MNARDKEREDMATNAIRVQDEKRLVRSVKVLTPLIHEDLTAAEDAGAPYYQAAGDKLHEVRQNFKSYREFMEWATKEFHAGESTIRNWMRFALKMRNGQPYDFELDNSPQPAAAPPKQSRTQSEVVYPNRIPRHDAPNWFDDVKEVTSRVDVKRLAQEKQEKVDESKLMHDLAMNLIDIGYRVLAKKLHPDHRGGSDAAMARLSKVRKILKGAI